ncbi:armadillo-type protein [Dissophora ornata]|nr:armadillo-type protein [Dissophora ornata]
MVHLNPNANSEETLEELRKVVAALPRMPKNIVDDTRHEKVLSYVSAFIAQADPVLLQTMLNDWAILDIFQACLAPDQDYRVSCVALRLLGYLLKYDTTQEVASGNGNNANLWQLLETRYPTILDFMIENTMGEEALTRYSCWFALERAMKYDDGARWLLKTGKCADMVSVALKDTSTYVLTAACQFLVAIIENRSIEAQKVTAHDTLLDTLLESISLYKLIHTMMTDQESETNRVAGLEFLWMITDSRSDRGTSFLRQSQLFFPYMDLLMDDSRLVRSRALDILSILLESASNPLSVLGKDLAPSQDMDLDKTDDQAMTDCFNYLLDHDVRSLVVLTDSLKALHVATGILDTMIKPLCQSDEMHGSGSSFKDTILSTVLWIIQALQETSKAAQNTSSHIHNSTIAVHGDGDLTKQLNQPGFQDLVKAQSRAKPTKVQNGQLLDEELFASAMTVVLGLLQRPATGSTSLRLVLNAVKEFFADDTLGKVLAHEKVGLDLANGLSLKLYDMEWDVRDNVVEFIGSLFAVDGPDHGVEWALKHDLLESVFQKLSDEEAYVRAASVHAFEIVMHDSRGWKGMCLKNLDERLSIQLPSLIRDSEAFVRRAVLEAMICLVSERESGTVLMVNGTNLFVDATFMSRLTLDDSDWEVRIRACEFLAAVWEHCLALDERADYRIRASKRLKDSDSDHSDSAQPPKPSSWWFYDIKGDKILVEATRDSSRLTRLTSVETLKKIKASIEERLGSDVGSIVKEDNGAVSEHGSNEAHDSIRTGKRPVDENTEDVSSPASEPSGAHPHAKFYAVLKSLDFERLDATTSVEQLYEEVLNVERVEDVVMEESENPNDAKVHTPIFGAFNKDHNVK